MLRGAKWLSPFARSPFIRFPEGNNLLMSWSLIPELLEGVLERDVAVLHTECGCQPVDFHDGGDLAPLGPRSSRSTGPASNSSRQPMPRPFSPFGNVASKSYEIQPTMARLKECGPAAQYAVAQRSLLVSKCTPGAKDADQHRELRGSIGWVQRSGGNGQMISAMECREHAVECRQMSERAPNPRVRDILIDMARSWERLALETEHSGPTSAKLVLRHQLRREV